MERAAALSRRGTLLLLLALAACGGLAYSCAAGPGPRPSTPPPKITSRFIARPSVTPAVAPQKLSLETFQPLLSQPRYEAARIAHEASDYAGAANAVRRSLREQPPPASELYRHRFLLARLLERANQPAAAHAEFVAAASVASPLSAYAELGAGRMELALGRPQRALAHVGRARDDLPLASGRTRLLADAAHKSGAGAIAVREYRALLESAPSIPERIQLGLRLLDALASLEDPSLSDRRDAVRLARTIALLAEDQPALARQAEAHRARWLSSFSSGDPALLSVDDDGAVLERLRLLMDARRFEEAQLIAESRPALDLEASGLEACEIEFLRGKLLAARRKPARAREIYARLAASRCSDGQRARALYAAGRAAQGADRYADAMQHFAELERRFPHETLADDARVMGALSALELGDEARFTDALSSMPDDYPDGDMLFEGCFRLALRRMEKRNFASALRPLTRAVERLPENEAGRGGDFAGRERYFMARVMLETGEREAALKTYEQLLLDLPLGYYVRAAFSALFAADPERARAALARAAERAEQEPPSLTRRLEPAEPGFERALELLAVGELELARSELDALSALSKTPELLFHAALLYARAGAVKLSSDAARLVFGSVPPRWPAGEWLEAWKLAYPTPYQELVQQHAKKNVLSPSLIYAVMREESAFDPAAHSPADAFGLMQLILPTAKLAAKPLGLPHDRIALQRPSINIPLGARVLSKYRDEFPQDPLLAIAAYNAGPGAAQRWKKARPAEEFDLWVELIPYVETRRYIKRVLGSAAVYAILYQESGVEAALRLPDKLSG
jgi:soluble lytic murein transglycosylase